MFSCQPPLSKDDLPRLNGYWEIEETDASDGTARAYDLNETIDFIELQGKNGFRKKVQPKPDGGFLASDDASFFEIREKDGHIYMCYHTEYTTWKEELLRLDKDRFSVVNEDKITYHYKRFEPISNTP